jgi:hypothetical protein
MVARKRERGCRKWAGWDIAPTSSSSQAPPPTFHQFPVTPSFYESMEDGSMHCARASGSNGHTQRRGSLLS